MDVEDVDLEDVEEMEGAELMTSGEEESDADDLYETMVDTQTCLGEMNLLRRRPRLTQG